MREVLRPVNWSDRRIAALPTSSSELPSVPPTAHASPRIPAASNLPQPMMAFRRPTTAAARQPRCRPTPGDGIARPGPLTRSIQNEEYTRPPWGARPAKEGQLQLKRQPQLQPRIHCGMDNGAGADCSGCVGCAALMRLLSRSDADRLSFHQALSLERVAHRATQLELEALRASSCDPSGASCVTTTDADGPAARPQDAPSTEDDTVVEDKLPEAFECAEANESYEHATRKMREMESAHAACNDLVTISELRMREMESAHAAALTKATMQVEAAVASASEHAMRAAKAEATAKAAEEAVLVVERRLMAMETLHAGHLQPQPAQLQSQAQQQQQSSVSPTAGATSVAACALSDGIDSSAPTSVLRSLCRMLCAFLC